MIQPANGITHTLASPYSFSSSVATKSHTRLQQQSKILFAVHGMYQAFTNGFSLSIISFASAPFLPSSSGHSLFPADETYQITMVSFIKLSSCYLHVRLITWTGTSTARRAMFHIHLFLLPFAWTI